MAIKGDEKKNQTICITVVTLIDNCILQSVERQNAKAGIELLH